MELTHIIKLIRELPKDTPLQYVRGNEICTFNYIDLQEPRIYAKTPKSKTISFAPSYIKDMVSRIEEYVPFNISQLMNNSGSNRPVIETIVAHTKEFYRYNKGNSTFVVWIPDTPHENCKLVDWNDDSVIRESKVNFTSVTTISKLVVELDEKKEYSEDELIEILKQMYNDGEEDYSKTANLLLFSLKYGEFFNNAKVLCEKAGIPLPTAVSDGKKLYNLIKGKKYGMAFYSPDMVIKTNGENKHLFASDSLQKIFYGAPGTGKSHCVKCETKEWEKNGRVVRTTFHPDSDYSTFVGAYKPTMEYMPLRNNLGQIIGKDGKYLAAGQQYEIEEVVTERQITYDFVPQAFLQAYIDAWKNREEPEYLIIEEINRGNCAQIFGDLFQLLDRGCDGYSEYAVRADKDLQKHLCKALADAEIEDYPKVKSGEELILPKNLYIRATMNTSDQSLFPIDSAFKRRWDWKYVPIAKGNDNGTELNWVIDVNGTKYDWWTFISTINKHVFETTNSEDKQLGFFFCKAKDNVINAETFVGKVIFYLWNDVFKDFGFDDPIFANKMDTDNPKLSFDKFYLADGKVNVEKIKMFLTNLEINPNEKSSENEDGEEYENENDKNRDNTKYSINGEGRYAKKNLAYELVKLYINNNPSLSATQVVNEWKTLGNLVSHFIETEAEYNLRTDSPRVKELNCNGEKIYVSTNGWGGKEKMQQLKSAVESRDWGLHIEEIKE